MPTIPEMVMANINHTEEKSFVHSSFFYPKSGGSQFIADVLANNIDISFGTQVSSITCTEYGKLNVDGCVFDEVIFCGNLMELPAMLAGRIDINGFIQDIAALEAHGTTSVFCETDATPYSWFYQPSKRHQSHRFICTGNFSSTNNAPGKMTCTVEFTNEVSEDSIKRQLRLMPYHPKYIAHNYSRYTYPIQRSDTRQMIDSLKKQLAKYRIRLVGRFAEWEYFNMDAAIASAMRAFVLKG